MSELKHTKHLVWLPESEAHRVQGHELSVLFSAFLPHFEELCLVTKVRGDEVEECLRRAVVVIMVEEDEEGGRRTKV